MDSQQAWAFAAAEITSSKVNLPSLRFLRSGRTYNGPQGTSKRVSNSLILSKELEHHNALLTNKYGRVRTSTATSLNSISVEDVTYSNNLGQGSTAPLLDDQEMSLVSELEMLSLPNIPSHPRMTTQYVPGPRRTSLRRDNKDNDDASQQSTHRQRSTHKMSQEGNSYHAIRQNFKKHTRRRSSIDSALQCCPPLVNIPRTITRRRSRRVSLKNIVAGVIPASETSLAVAYHL